MSHPVARAWCIWLLAWCCLPMGKAIAKTVPVTTHGVAVLCVDDAARTDAMALARAVYRDPALRPRYDEATARELIGGSSPGRSSLASAMVAARKTTGDARRRLLVSIGRDVRAKLLAVVEAAPKQDARVRVLDIQQGRFLSLALKPTLSTSPRGKLTRGWTDTVMTLRALHDGTAAGPRRSPPPPASSAGPVQTEPKSIWSSPWFWTGIGVVAAAGITVIVLSQTAAKSSDVVAIDGQIGQ
ncbi:MAG: hypothetical protein VB934_12020 [Polyangiaceae bacterium]